jgi:choline dehydrogenase
VEEHPGPHVQGDAVKQAIKDSAFSHHATGTCAIGGDNDPFACLDSKFRVWGVDGLRVVDASVFPQVPGAYPVLPIFMISEKAADVILDEARYC